MSVFDCGSDCARDELDDGGRTKEHSASLLQSVEFGLVVVLVELILCFNSHDDFVDERCVCVSV